MTDLPCRPWWWRAFLHWYACQERRTMNAAPKAGDIPNAEEIKAFEAELTATFVGDGFARAFL